jgi:hypothetical protein
MKSKFLYSSYVINFLNVDFSADFISDKMNIMVTKNIESIDNWEILFSVIYNNCDKILIFHKTKSNAREKTKEIVIHIPIPTTDLDYIEWGIDSKKNNTKIFFSDFNKYAFGLDTDFSTNSNRQEYILNCLTKAISKLFEIGFTMNGVKVKIPLSRPHPPTGRNVFN